jgi:hypothetical protein
MTEEKTLAQKLDAVRDEATKNGAMIVTPLLLDPEKSNGPLTILLSVDEMKGLVGHLKPRVLFVVEGTFDAFSEVVTELDDGETDEEELAEKKKVKALLKRWQPHDGEICRVVISMMVDGVLYHTMEEAGWLSEFQTEVEELADDL